MGETKQIVQVNGGNILLFELAFRLLTLPLLLQAVAALSRVPRMVSSPSVWPKGPAHLAQRHTKENIKWQSLK